MPKVQVYLNPEAYEILIRFRDEVQANGRACRNLDEATNGLLIEYNRMRKVI